MQEVGEKVKRGVELMRRWRILAPAGTTLSKDDVSFLGKGDSEQAMKTWKFLIETVVSDNDKPKETGKDPI